MEVKRTLSTFLDKREFRKNRPCQNGHSRESGNQVDFISWIPNGFPLSRERWTATKAVQLRRRGGIMLAPFFDHSIVNFFPSPREPSLNKLQPYPFEKLRQLFSDVTPNAGYAPISLGIGEPKHPTPAFIQKALSDNLHGLANYPTTAGSEALRACDLPAGWSAAMACRLNPATQVLPVNGSREALFALAQTVIDPRADALVLCPNPFYQIYEGAAYLAGAQPYFVNSDPARNFAPDYSKRTAGSMVRACSCCMSARLATRPVRY
jgi:DNA-binding transcriptional MocR family regulator